MLVEEAAAGCIMTVRYDMKEHVTMVCPDEIMKEANREDGD